MGTKILIEFDEHIDPSKLMELVHHIAAQCEEDEDGHGWCEGKHVIRCNMRGKLSDKTRKKAEMLLKDFREESCIEHSSRDLIYDIMFYYEDDLSTMDDDELLSHLAENAEYTYEDDHPLREFNEKIQADLALRKVVLNES